MTKIGRGIIAVLVLGILAAGMSGCKKKEGPMERTGKEIDKAITSRIGEGCLAVRWLSVVASAPWS